MAEKDEDSLIGYDPLAWMRRSDLNQGPQQNNAEELESRAASQFVNENEESLGLETNHDEAPTIASEPYNLERGDRVSVVLDPVLNIQNVAALHQRFTRMLGNFEAIDIDASNVTIIDTATLQLLLILKQTAIGLQKSISIDFPSDKFIEASKLLGVAEMLEVDQVASGFF